MTERLLRLPGPAPSLTALVELTRLPVFVSDRKEVLQQAAELCARALGRDVSVTILMGSPLSPEALASTDDVAQHLDGAQLMAAEGPSVAAWESQTTVVSDDLHHDPRWPALAARLDGSDAVVTICVPLRIGDDLIGLLTAYLPPDHVDELDADASALSELLGGAVAAILHETEIKESLRETAAQLKAATVSRAVIEQAKGIVMAARRCDEDQAFAVLVELSSRQNVKLREIASRIVAQAREAPG